MKGMRRIALAFGAAALLALGAATALATPAAAAAIVTIDYGTTSSSDPGEPLIDDCRPELTGTIFGTGEFRYETVETSEGIHFNGTETGTARIDWSDGSYSLIKVRDHFLFTTRFGAGTTVFTNPHVDTVLTYNAEGEFLSGNRLHRVEHITVTDGAVVRVQFDHFHFNFFGGC
jgi:hypothetical protein